jgi:hypothetical protein
MEIRDKMNQKQSVAVQIALQTHVLRTCPEHRELFFDDESDPASAFALAVELVRQRRPYVGEFHGNSHALTDLLSETLAAAPGFCPQCAREGGGREPGDHYARA